MLASFRKQLHKASECAAKRSSVIANLKQELLQAKDKSHADAALVRMGMGTEECKSLADSIIAKLDSKLEVLSSRLIRLVLTAKTIFALDSASANRKRAT